MRELRELATEKDTARNSKAPDCDLLTWAGLDIFASSLGMWAAFTSRSIRRAGSDRVAEAEVK